MQDLVLEVTDLRELKRAAGTSRSSSVVKSKPVTLAGSNNGSGGMSPGWVGLCVLSCIFPHFLFLALQRILQMQLTQTRITPPVHAHVDGRCQGSRFAVPLSV